MKSVEQIFFVWKTIKLGIGLRTADDFRRVLENHDFQIGDETYDILGKPAFRVASEEAEVDLVVVTVSELGFKRNTYRGAYRKDIYKRALEFGLELCPPEVGPQLRLQYKDQPMGERLHIGMVPIRRSRDDPRVFSVERLLLAGSMKLDSFNGSRNQFWDSSCRWVFVRGK